MAGITVNKPMRGIRGKDKVKGLRKPKESSSKPNGLTWLAGPWKERGMAEVETKWAIRAKTFVSWTMPSPLRNERK